jgi:histone acetyltransferase (RNA polymerase elongator complex component)
MRSPEVVINDLKQIGSKQPIYLLCAQITTSKKWLERFVELKKEFKLDFEYVTDINCREVTEDKIEMLKESNCIQATMGIESTNQDVLDLINKKITVDDIENAVLICKDKNLVLSTSFMYNVAPFENVGNDINFYKRHKGINPSAGIMKIYPGTPLEEQTIIFDYIYEFGINSIPVNRGVHEGIARLKKWESVLNVQTANQDG